LERSIHEIVRRHDTLRTGFSEQEGGEPVQIVVPELRMRLSPVDITTHGDDEIESSRWVQQEISRPFDLAAAPLMCATLFRRSADDHLLVLVLHHIISDAWSINVLLREMSTFYKLFSGAGEKELPELAIQYGDFARWQREPAQRQIFDSQLCYWKDQLAGAPHDLEVPVDFRRPALPSHRPGTETIALGEEFSRAVKNLADSEQSSRFMLLTAVFQTLIYRLTGHPDVIIGSTISGRTQRQTDPLIGFFVNVLVLRAKFQDGASFRTLLKRVRSTCLEAYEHQDLPFELLVKELCPERHANRNPLFQYLINMHNLPEQVLDLADVAVHPVEATEVRAPYDLELVVSQRNGELRLTLLYATDLFRAERAGEMLRQYKYLLEQIVDNPDEQIDRYSLITPTARQVLPDPTKPLDRTWHGSVPQFLSDHARRNPDRLAVVDAHGAMSYHDLEQRSSRLANYLLAQGIGREDVVAIYADGSANLVWALLGIFKAGAAFVILDPAFPTARLETYMRQSRPAAWLQLEGAGELPRELGSCLAELSCRCQLTLPDLADPSHSGFLASYSDEDPKVTIDPGQLAYLAFTSGSTGKPKAVLGLHGSLTHFIPWMSRRFDLNENDRFSALSGISWNQLQREIFTALCCGATLCMPDAETVVDPQLLLEWLRREAITVLHIAPAKARPWVDFDAVSASSLALRSVFFGGDELRQCDVEVIRRAAPRATIVNHYAATETQRAVGCYVVYDERKKKEPDVSCEGELLQGFPLGQEMPDVQLLVLNKAERLAGPGELGEICVRSPHIARGYLDDPELTLARFIRNPFTNDPTDRLYKTGEFGRFRPDGNIDFVARSESRVNIRGHRIELGEIEAALNGHPAVRESVVVAHGDIPDEGVIAYVSLKQDQAARVDELRSAVKARLPDPMMPSTFVVVDSLPRTANGKIDRRALPLPDQRRPDLRDVFVAPRTATEQRLAGIWAHLFRVERVGIHDNFFELGGHSLLAMQFINRFRSVFQVELPLRTLFNNPTIEGIAVELEQHLRRRNE
jgi:amino acid adenylation domain-containing protein